MKIPQTAESNRIKTGTIIRVQLCLSLVALYLVFIFAIDRTFPRIHCTIAAALTHYFLLTTMAWMAVEARYLHIRSIKIDSDEVGFMKNVLICACAWGKFYKT